MDELVVCEGGPYAGFWWWLKDWRARRDAALAMGYTAAHPAAPALGYQASRRRMDHPKGLGSGIVAVWAP